MPVTDEPEPSPLAVLAVNSLRETYKQRGPHAFDADALILFMAVGSIIARTRGARGPPRCNGGPPPCSGGEPRWVRRRPIACDQLSLPG
jgi:hypothetical protein